MRKTLIASALATGAIGSYAACSGDDGASNGDASPDANASDVVVTDGGGGLDSGALDGGAGDGGFVHPGILVDSNQLAFVKAHLTSDPWKTALAKTQSSKYASKTYKPSAVANVKCDSFSKDPDSGATETDCTTQIDDAIAAYTDALLWSFTGDAAYATTGIAILNAWSKTITQMTGSNAPLQSAWFVEMITRAAEIFRWSSAGFAPADEQAFATMLTTVFLPEVVNGSPYSNGNWELSMADAVMNIGVYRDDHATFASGLALWRGRVPAYIYMTGDTDGGLPIAPPGGKYDAGTALAAFWFDQTTHLVDGVCQETCRDFGHVQLGFASMVNAAETARIQDGRRRSDRTFRITASVGASVSLRRHRRLRLGGHRLAERFGRVAAPLLVAARRPDGYRRRDHGVDLYGEQQARIVAGYEFHTIYMNGATPPSWLCGGNPNISTSPTWEIGYNELANRNSVAMPNTGTLVTKIRPTSAALQMAWETLTHAATGNAGDP